VAGEAHVAEDDGEDVVKVVEMVEVVDDVEVVEILLGAKQLQALLIFELDAWQFTKKVGNAVATVRICAVYVAQNAAAEAGEAERARRQLSP
jgi:hypothetical protein